MIIACDFDGTLCEDKFPDIGKPKKNVINWIKTQQTKGHKTILWTCRTGPSLKEAIDWCKSQGLTFDAYNDNIDEVKYGSYLGKEKIIADIYLDDKAMKISDIENLINIEDFIKGQ